MGSGLPAISKIKSRRGSPYVGQQKQVKREEQEQVGLGLGLVDQGKAERDERATKRRAPKPIPAGAVGARALAAGRGR